MSATIVESVFRRVQMMFGRARVTHTDDSGPVQIMQVRSSALEVSDGRKRMAEFGFTSNPPYGADVLTLHVAGDRGAGTVFATNHQQSRPTGLQQGETMLYSEDGKYVYMTASGGISVFANGQPVNVTGATTVTINASTEVLMNTPILKCTGDILDNCNTNTDTVAGMRAVANGHTHPILSVQTGFSNINTQPPTQDE
jgi:phage baseplate assembly protein V